VHPDAQHPVVADDAPNVGPDPVFLAEDVQQADPMESIGVGLDAPHGVLVGPDAPAVGRRGDDDRLVDADLVHVRDQVAVSVGALPLGRGYLRPPGQFVGVTSPGVCVGVYQAHRDEL